MKGLLEGVRVVESAVLLVGDFVGRLLADEGADVVKIEQPGSGDYLRKIAGQFAPNISPMHVAVNRNKRSLTLDPRGTEGREVVRRLIEQADVFITGQVGDVPFKLGLDEASLRAINPRIVYCQTTGYGNTGPYSRIPTHGQMTEALGGSPQLGMGPQGRVERIGPGLPSSGTVLGPLYSVYAIAAALWRRERTGEGATLDISCSDAVVATGWARGTGALNAHKLRPEPDVAPWPEGGTDVSAKYTYYQTGDGNYLLFCAIEKKFWDRFCEAAGRHDLKAWHSTETVVDYGENDTDLMDVLQALFHTRTLQEWTALFATVGIPAGPAVSIDRAGNDPHLLERKAVLTEHHPVVGDLTVTGNPVRVQGRDFEITRSAPELGEHSDEVLAELGYTAVEVAALRRSGTI
jgi:crotonobetainyl-CoA:carnitine CoA-transferase CaiB-like acyl-CoA transferase